MGQVGNVYLNFGLWGIAILPAWLVLKDFGTKGDVKMAREDKATHAHDDLS
jgi:hypothetical protein